MPNLPSIGLKVPNKLKSLKVAKSKDDDAVCDVMYDSVCVMLCVMYRGDQ